MSEIPVWQDVSPEQFEQDIRPLGVPAVLRGLAQDWPAVLAGRNNSQALVDYIAHFADSQPVGYVHASPDIEGRFHYSADLRGLNFERGKLPLAVFLDMLLAQVGTQRPPALAAQGLSVPHLLPGFTDENRLAILPDSIAPRIWIGNAIKVATHNDPSENVACVVAGRRRFTVFPPEQLANLYMGPFHFTPAGTPISMVHLTSPDFDRYPRFAEALRASQSADLEPGDAIYLPYQWYHHVESRDPLSILVNYWWNPARQDGGSPWDAMLHGMMSLRGLPPEQRRAWRAAFDNYVFLEHGDPAAHLPAHVRGVLGADTSGDLEHMRQELVKNLTSPPR